MSALPERKGEIDAVRNLIERACGHAPKLNHAIDEYDMKATSVTFQRDDIEAALIGVGQLYHAACDLEDAAKALAKDCRDAMPEAMALGCTEVDIGTHIVSLKYAAADILVNEELLPQHLWTQPEAPPVPKAKPDLPAIRRLLSGEKMVPGAWFSQEPKRAMVSFTSKKG